MKYRFAVPADLPAITLMLRAYLMEQQESGSPVLYTKRTLAAYEELARAYLAGGMFGVVVLSYEGDRLVGFALAGEDTGGLRYDTTLGKVAFIWVVWVLPSHRKTGAGLGMLTFGRARLLELGFVTASMSVRENNPQGQALTLSYGAVPTEREYLFDLRGEPAHLNRKETSDG